MIRKFIDRPVLSLVISLFIVLVGVLSLYTLPISQFPEIVPPCVTVTAKYTGANADVCVKAVATPIEKAINGVAGMTYINSVSNNSGVVFIQVFFKVGTDPDLAAVNVQNRVTSVLDELPAEVIKAGVITEKEVNGMLMYLNLYSNNKSVDESFIFNFADINIIKELKRIDGVGFADILGQKEYSMRVWLKPDRLIAYNISPQEVLQSIKNQNVEAAPGRIGENSDKGLAFKQYVLLYGGKFTEKEQYENLIIKSENGSYVKLKDVANVEFGSSSYYMKSETDSKPSASIMIKQRPGSNAKQIIADIKSKMEDLKVKTFPPEMDYNLAYDVSRFLDASIHEVIKTLIEAFILVFIVVFIFLQDFRSTLIPALAVPVSLIGAFIFMSIFGFTINMLTLFALVLSIGIVVDDAIVVVEAVHAQMSQNNLSPKMATYAAMEDITEAIISITLVMSAVFIPVSFLPGPVGVFYKQFSLTMAFAIIISGINALTLTPALCALLLKNNHHNTKEKKSILDKFFNWFNFKYNKIERNYALIVYKYSNKRGLILGVLALFFVLNVVFFKIVPTGFIPTEDQGMIYVNVTTPVGSTVDRTQSVMSKIQEKSKDIKEIESISTLAGYSLISESAGENFGMGMINLSSWNDRKKSVDDVITEFSVKCKDIFDGNIEFFSPPTVPGFGNSSGFELRFVDKSPNSSFNNTVEETKKFVNILNNDKVLKNVISNSESNFPFYLLKIDQELASKNGVTIDNTMSSLQTLVGSEYTSNFIKYGQLYKVMVQASPEYRAKPEDILNLSVKNIEGNMTPLSSFVKMEKVYGPDQITRFNLYPSTLITGEPRKGFSSGDAIEKIEELAKTNLPKGFELEWTGMSKEEKAAGNNSVYIFALCLVFVFLILSAKYESFILPISILLSLPVGIFGTMFSLYFFGIQNNIYVQISLIMLAGLLSKNAILIIEYAEIKRLQGYQPFKAIVFGAKERLRPILMTSFAFVIGLIPMCLASGAGAIGNKSIGIASVGGMLIGTVFGVFIIPGLYLIFVNLIPKKVKTNEV